MSGQLMDYLFDALSIKNTFPNKFPQYERQGTSMPYWDFYWLLFLKSIHILKVIPFLLDCFIGQATQYLTEKQKRRKLYFTSFNPLFYLNDSSLVSLKWVQYGNSPVWGEYNLKAYNGWVFADTLFFPRQYWWTRPNDVRTDNVYHYN